MTDDAKLKIVRYAPYVKMLSVVDVDDETVTELSGPITPTKWAMIKRRAYEKTIWMGCTKERMPQ